MSKTDDKAQKNEAANKAELALVKKDVVDVVTAKVREFQEHGELHMPANYSPENAMKSAWLILQTAVDKDKKPVLEVCTKNSIANALLDMVVQGLNPAKKQCYFIAYGKELTCQRSYFGTMSVTKQVAGAKEIYYQVVYKGDEFLYEIKRGRKEVIKHVQNLENVSNDNIIAAYCIIEFGDERPDYTDIMTMDQLKKAWAMSKMYPIDEKTGEVKASSTHGKYTDQMAIKTVVNRTCKSYINSSNDSSLLIKRFNRTDEEATELEVAQEIEENANSEFIDVEYEFADSKSNGETGDKGADDLPPTGTNGAGPGF